MMSKQAVFLSVNLVLVVQIFLIEARAEEFRDIIRAKSVGRVESLGRTSDEVSHNRRVCAEQLKGKRIPSACFKIIHKQSSPEILWLNRQCAVRAHASKDLGELKLVVENAQVSAECRSVAHERLEDIRYVALKNSSPEAFLVLVDSARAQSPKKTGPNVE